MSLQPCEKCVFDSTHGPPFSVCGWSEVVFSTSPKGTGKRIGIRQFKGCLCSVCEKKVSAFRFTEGKEEQNAANQ